MAVVGAIMPNLFRDPTAFFTNWHWQPAGMLIPLPVLAKHLCATECGPLVCSCHKVLLGASGSVAAIKVVELAYLLAEFAEVKLVLTKAARHFIQQDGLPFVIHGMACSNASRAVSVQK